MSAGSIIFAENLPGNLGVIKATLNVHCTSDICERTGKINIKDKSFINLGNNQAIAFDDEGNLCIMA